MSLNHTMDPVLFAQDRLAFHPDANQARVLDPSIRRGLLNCSRQWGKSTVTAVRAVHHACAKNPTRSPSYLRPPNANPPN